MPNESIHKKLSILKTRFFSFLTLVIFHLMVSCEFTLDLFLVLFTLTQAEIETLYEVKLMKNCQSKLVICSKRNEDFTGSYLAVLYKELSIYLWVFFGFFFLLHLSPPQKKYIYFNSSYDYYLKVIL